MKKIIAFLLFAFPISLFAQVDSTNKDTIVNNVIVTLNITPDRKPSQYQLVYPDIYTKQQVPNDTYSMFDKLKGSLRTKAIMGISPTKVIKTDASVILQFEETKITLTKDEYITYLEFVVVYQQLYAELLRLLRDTRQQRTYPQMPLYQNNYDRTRPNNGGW